MGPDVQNYFLVLGGRHTRGPLGPSVAHKRRSLAPLEAATEAGQKAGGRCWFRKTMRGQFRVRRRDFYVGA